MSLDCFAGCIGGAAGVVVGQPLDTVKIQTAKNLKYNGIIHCVVKTVKNETIRGLYKGIGPPLYGAAFQNSVIFGVWGQVKPWAKGPGGDTFWAHFAAGGVTGAVQSFIVSPMELVKTRMQIDESRQGLKIRNKSWIVLKHIYLNEGGLRKGVFKGLCATLAREIPGFGIYFAVCESLTRGGDENTFYLLMVGGVAGVLSWIAPCAIDVVKTRIQSDTIGYYSGIFDCVKKTYSTEGAMAFSRGLASLLLRAFVVNAAVFAVYSSIMRLTIREEILQNIF